MIFGSPPLDLRTLFQARTLVLFIHEVICLQSGFSFSLLFRSGEQAAQSKIDFGTAWTNLP
jgi:hypothetical protein